MPFFRTIILIVPIKQYGISYLRFYFTTINIRFISKVRPDDFPYSPWLFYRVPTYTADFTELRTNNARRRSYKALHRVTDSFCLSK